MSQYDTMILHSGGLRSLVAMASVMSDPKPPRIYMVHVRDGRPNADRRLDHARQQVEHFNVLRLIELELPQSPSRERAQSDQETVCALAHGQMLLMAVGEAIELAASCVVWPAQFDGEFDACAKATEQIVLVESLVKLDHDTPPAFETPLLELTNQQVIELGEQLAVPWDKAWSCSLQGDRPCRVCAPCRRRHAAFEAAGIIDPIDQAVPMR